LWPTASLTLLGKRGRPLIDRILIIPAVEHDTPHLPASGDQARIVWRERITIAWMAPEVEVAIFGALSARSVALLGLGSG
jgi:hypothetical protein